MLVPLAVVLALSSAGPGASRKGIVPWVALVQVRGEAPPTWADTLRATAEEVKEGRTWVAPPAVSIADAQLALGCTGWNDACAGQIASMTGAAMALVIEIDATGDGVTVSAQPVKAGGAGTAAAEKLELSGRAPADLKLAEELVRGVARGQRPAFLFVDTDVAKADVWLDGERVGEAPWRGRVSPGEHNIVLRAEGKVPAARQIAVKAGTTVRESIALSAAGPVADAPATAPLAVAPNDPSAPSSQPPSAVNAPPMTTLGWSLAGSGGAVTAAGLALLSVTIFDLTKRSDCGGQVNACVPPTEMLFGIYRVDQRTDFFAHQAAWILGSAAAVSVGALVGAAGFVLATGAAPGESGPDTASAAAPSSSKLSATQASLGR